MSLNTKTLLINSNFGEELTLEFIDEITGVPALNWEDRFGPELTLLDVIAIMTPDRGRGSPVKHICMKCHNEYGTYAEFVWHRADCVWTVDDQINFMEESYINHKFLYWLGDTYESRLPQSNSQSEHRNGNGPDSFVRAYGRE